jgi:hypothetical protein
VSPRGGQRAREDTEAWYRQFWPWFLIALPGSVVIAAFITLYIAMRHADDLVAEEYYKDGLAINRQLEKQEAAQHRGYTASVAIEAMQVVVTTEGITDYAELRLRLSHPLEADRDLSLSVRRTDANRFTARLPRTVEAFWHWTLDAGEQGDWRLDGSLDRQDIRSARAG